MLPSVTPWSDSIRQTLKDKVWLAMGVSAVVSALFGGIFVGVSGLLEGVSIVIIGFVTIFITAYIDYIKDKKF